MKNILLFFLIVFTLNLHSQNKVIDFWFGSYELFSFDDTSFIDYILFEGDNNIWQIGRP